MMNMGTGDPNSPSIVEGVAEGRGSNIKKNMFLEQPRQGQELGRGTDDEMVMNGR